MGFIDPDGEVGMVKFVVTHAQAVARLAGIDSISAIGKSITHVF